MKRQILSGVVGLAVFGQTLVAMADGTRPTIVRNAGPDPIGVRVDSGGRGMPLNATMKDGSGAHRLASGQTAIAKDTNLLDCPTVYIYNKDGDLVCVRKLHYIPFIKDESSHLRYDGSQLIAE